MKRTIKDYLIDILNECEYLLERVKIFDYNEFLQNEDLKKAFIRSLEVIGEAVKKIPYEVRKQYPKISWRDMAGMRDKLIHEYFGVDYEVVWKTVREEIPHLKISIANIIEDLKKEQENG
jgi:uncharacterized protein with HEPN domain